MSKVDVKSTSFKTDGSSWISSFGSKSSISNSIFASSKSSWLALLLLSCVSLSFSKGSSNETSKSIGSEELSIFSSSILSLFIVTFFWLNLVQIH